jgi:hypothetical protein
MGYLITAPRSRYLLEISTVPICIKTGTWLNYKFNIVLSSPTIHHKDTHPSTRERRPQLVCHHESCVTAAYDYKLVLRSSLLFYEAQRSGKLPCDQKVTWRKDSALNDRGQRGEDLTGGYYDGKATDRGIL